MSFSRSFIAFHDLTPEALFLWASDSIEECLGYTPEEVIGRSAYAFIIPDDHQASRNAHHKHILNDLASTQAVHRYRRKDGGIVVISGFFSVCYEFIVNCSSVVDFDEKTSTFKSSKQPLKQFERIRCHHTAFRSNTWDHNSLQLQVRVCMILNRFTRSLNVLYASPSCQLILLVDAEAIEGKPLLLFIRADDLASFVEQVELAKSSNVISHMRFCFQSPNWPTEIPCEALVLGTADGLVFVLQRCRSFVRKRLVTSMEQYEREHAQKSASIGSMDRGSQGCNFITTFSHSPPTVDRGLTGDWIGRGCTFAESYNSTTSPLTIGNFRRIVELNEDEEEGEEEENGGLESGAQFIDNKELDKSTDPSTEGHAVQEHFIEGAVVEAVNEVQDIEMA
ncbi:hypothetical protein BGZ70_002700 [Mortierella alpina]|uniref:PAS domain-containing protein n=1 Tax=Mortierella alpina TaxID=64518 RepID=A0A9P6IWV4_MORAP|nr:hypothetical protein BGZ70_002700 [Mortierella alpina]